ncbi:MAG: hypothetical protein ABIL09_08865 [Gemmatimonadota bacterium]
MRQQLMDFPVSHAGRRKVMHPELGREILAQTAVRYLRFLRPVRVSRLELAAVRSAGHSGRWVPGVPTHPAHLIVSTLDRAARRWTVVRDVDLPPNPRFAGAGLSQDVPIDEMEAFFTRAVAEQAPHRIELGDLATDCLKVECDREHPVWPNHGECNGGPYNVPFGALQNLRAIGAELAAATPPAYRHKLERAGIRPSAPPGMALDARNPLQIVFRGSRLSVGFSLVRPMLTHLAWDHFGRDGTAGSRLLFRGVADSLGGLSGPSYITPDGNFIAQNMSGRVEVAENRVRYLGLDSGCGIAVDAAFTVTADALVLELEQRAAGDLPALEGEAWRLLWNMRAGLTSVAAVPVEREGRNGFVELPALIAADAGGCLSVRRLEGEGALHTESHRAHEARSTGFVLAAPDTADAPLVIPRGPSRAVFELRPGALMPVPEGKEAVLTAGVKTCWTAGFSAFRPEFGGFSNNAISTNCHVNQHTAFDFAAFTARPPVGPEPLALVRFSLGRALMDGGGYGYHRSLYLDSDPILLSGAGRIVQLSGDRRWLQQVGPGVGAAARRLLGGFDAREGMIVCRALSGNSGSYRWSSNAMDVVGFGHIDAYVNAWSFRALRNAAALCTLLGDRELARQCGEVAAALAANYARQLVNPETGWVAGWRSRDGQLHDFGFLWINGVACAFGVMDDDATRRALTNLEARRQEVFPESGYQGLPLNLLPIDASDHMLPRIGYHLRPTYENYTDGALSPVFPAYYLRALSRHGFEKESRALVDRLEQGFADGLFHGPYGTGKEFMTWTGADSGYEGTFGPNSGPLYAIAVERGFIVPPDPEWWLAI